MAIDTSKDKFLKVAQNTGWQIGSGGVPDPATTTIPLVNATNIPTDTAVIVTIDRVDANGTPTPSKMERVVGRISGNNLVDCIRGVAGTAQTHAAGAVAEVVIDAILWNKLIEGILKEHNSDGTHILDGGWVQLTSVIPTRQSADDPTFVLNFAGVDLTSLVSPGMRIKWTQNGTVRYGLVTVVALSGSDTRVTLYGGTDYNVDDTATYTISEVFFSHHKAPFGFPLDPNKWTEKYQAGGRISKTNLNLNWQQLGSAQLSVPIGAWSLSYNFMLQIKDGASSFYNGELSLSTSTSAESDIYNYTVVHLENQGGYTRVPVYREAFKNLTSKTIYYVICRGYQSGLDGLLQNMDIDNLQIKAISAYL